jgi:hypothetical protein
MTASQFEAYMDENPGSYTETETVNGCFLYVGVSGPIAGFYLAWNGSTGLSYETKLFKTEQRARAQIKKWN